MKTQWRAICSSVFALMLFLFVFFSFCFLLFLYFSALAYLYICKNDRSLAVLTCSHPVLTSLLKMFRKLRSGHQFAAFRMNAWYFNVLTDSFMSLIITRYVRHNDELAVNLEHRRTKSYRIFIVYIVA